jgi:hypothetical protein
MAINRGKAGTFEKPTSDRAEIVFAERPDKAEEPISAAIIAGGVGTFALGLLTTLAEASERFKEAIVLNDRVGPLSGKTTFAVAIWLVAWAILHFALRGRSFPVAKALPIAVVLIVLGLLGTFPPIFELFAAE